MSNTANTALQSLIVTAQQANVGLGKQAETLAKLLQTLESVVAVRDELINEIAVRQAERAALEVEFAEQKRAAEVRFALDLQANQLTKVQEVLASNGRTAIEVEVLNKLRADFQNLSDKFADTVEAEVSKVRAQERTSAAVQINTAKLELAAATANEKAQINSLNEKNLLLAQQVKSLENQIAADRSARVEEAKARGNAVVNVTPTGR